MINTVSFYTDLYTPDYTTHGPNFVNTNLPDLTENTVTVFKCAESRCTDGRLGVSHVPVMNGTVHLGVWLARALKLVAAQLQVMHVAFWQDAQSNFALLQQGGGLPCRTLSLE